MNFTSIAFYLLFCSSIFILFLIDRIIKRNPIQTKVLFLIIVSLLFCGWNDYRFALLVLFEALLIHIIALQIEKTCSNTWLCLGVSIILFFLCIFKYFNFFVDTFHFFGLSIQDIDLFLPIGISFYSFSAIGYLLDVSRNKYSAQKNVFHTILFMCFFPKLTAGPIISADSFFEQITKNKKINNASLFEGFQIILTGLFKKNVLADHISVYVNNVYGNINMYSAGTLVFTILAYSIQIYLDFSGYSDLAIGCSKCLGFEMPKNFNIPYIARNVTEFWKRWHITLSEWLMKYLYISLGGNRKGNARMYMNLLLTMVIGGLWHGASWNYVIWGLFHGLALCVHKLFMKLTGISKETIPSKLSFGFGIIFTYIYVCFCWIFFRIEKMSEIRNLFHNILNWTNGVSYYSPWVIVSIVIVMIATVVAFINSKKEGFPFYSASGFYINKDLTKFINMVLLFVMIGLIFGLAYAYSNPFIYANF